MRLGKRPIPNFYSLAGKSSRVDVVVQDGDIINLEEGLSLDVNMFIGDAIPVRGDIPIIINEPEMMIMRCFESDEYKAIMNKRIESVDARGLINKKL